MEGNPGEELHGTEAVLELPLLVALREDHSIDPSLDPGLSQEDLLFLYSSMQRLRALDEKAIALQRSGRIGFYAPSSGQEAAEVGAGFALREGDWIFPSYRDHGMALMRGYPLHTLVGQLFGNRSDATRGRQMPNHWGQRRLHLPAPSSPTGTQCLQAVGFAEAGRYFLAMEQGIRCADVASDEVVWVSLGDGTTSEGEFWESLNTACNLRLPMLYVIEDNGYAISVPVDVQTAGGSISKLVTGFPNLTIFEVDGCDFVESYRVMGEAVARVRSGEGPVLVHAHVVRPYSHSLSDDERLYKPAAERQREAERDPIERTARLLREHYDVSQEELERVEAEVQAEVNAAAEMAVVAPQPDPATWADFIYSPEVDPTSERFETKPAVGDPAPKTMVDLLNACLRDEMRRDERIVVFGEDVADASHETALSEVKGKGGVFKVTHGLQRLYGSRRVFNTPLAEANIVGRAFGMALRGLKPVVEIQFLDYIWPAYMQIRDELSNVRWRSGGQWSAPVVVRVPSGGYLKGGGPYHSQSGEVLFTHIPGLRVVMPSNALDANGLLRTAIRCDDPVIFLEHKHLYRQTHNKGPYPGPDYTVPFGKAATVREGSDLTVITYGATVVRSLQAAKRLADSGGGEVEILDLRSLAPYDWDAIGASVRRTHRALVVYEDCLSFGYGAEIAARIADELFAHLDAPVRRVAGKDTFVAYAPTLEDVILPQVDSILAGMKALLAY